MFQIGFIFIGENMSITKLSNSNESTLKSISESLYFDGISSLKITYASDCEMEKIINFEIISDSDIPNEYKNYIFLHWDVADITLDVVNNIYPKWSKQNSRGVLLITATGDIIIEHSDTKNGTLTGESFKIEVQNNDVSNRFI